MKNNKSKFTDKISAAVIILLPVVFLVNWILNVLKSGGANSTGTAAIGAVVLIGYVYTFLTAFINAAKKRKEPDPWREDFTGQKSYGKNSQPHKGNIPVRNRQKGNRSGVVIALFALTLLIKDIQQKGGIQSADEGLSTAFMVLVMLLIITGNVRENAGKRKGAKGGADSCEDVRYLTPLDYENRDFEREGIEFYCPYCDGKLEQSFDYCPHCGNRLHK